MCLERVFCGAGSYWKVLKDRKSYCNHPGIGVSVGVAQILKVFISLISLENVDRSSRYIVLCMLVDIGLKFYAVPS